MVQLSHPYMTTGKTIALTRWTFAGKAMSLLFNMLPKLVIALLPRSRGLLISGLQSPSAVTLEPKKIKSATVSTVSPSICHEVMGLDAMILVCWMLSFESTFSLSSFTFIKRLFSSSLLSAVRAAPQGWKEWTADVIGEVMPPKSSSMMLLLSFVYRAPSWQWPQKISLQNK